MPDAAIFRMSALSSEGSIDAAPKTNYTVDECTQRAVLPFLCDCAEIARHPTAKAALSMSNTSPLYTRSITQMRDEVPHVAGI